MRLSLSSKTLWGSAGARARYVRLHRASMRKLGQKARRELASEGREEGAAIMNLYA